MFWRKAPPLKIGRLSVRPERSLREPSSKSPAVSDVQLIEPFNDKLGYNSAVATPTSAVCAASCRSALRISGRRRNTSAGTPATISTGATGIGLRGRSEERRGGKRAEGRGGR